MTDLQLCKVKLPEVPLFLLLSGSMNNKIFSYIPNAIKDNI